MSRFSSPKICDKIETICPACCRNRWSNDSRIELWSTAFTVSAHLFDLSDLDPSAEFQMRTAFGYLYGLAIIGCRDNEIAADEFLRLYKRAVCNPQPVTVLHD